eukprot:Pompholyxophrys_punicea_v1_NODE_463_length_1898_cov_5.250136.p2 type:complete len:122 gc:universal NODE_463_length_1898_cov_5.250136:1755-1390(-)
MTDAVWPQWVNHWLHCIPPAESRKNIILFLDGYGSHVSDAMCLQMMKEHKVICACLPPHTSSATQPLDVSVFGPLKKKSRSLFADWLMQHPGESYTRDMFPGKISPCERKKNTDMTNSSSR